MAYIPNSNSVVAFQSDPTKLVATASVIQGTSPWIVAPNNSSVITISSGSVATVIIGGSIAASFTPPANQSVSGTVQTDVRGSVAVAIISGSIAATFTPPANQSVSGTVGASIIGQLPAGTAPLGSVATLQGTNPWIIVGSVYGAGSVVSFQGGTQVTSLVSTIPSSVIVGASIFGQLPAGTAVLGSIATLQGTNPWIITGSVQGSFSPSGNQSVSGTVGASVIGTAPVKLESSNASVISIIPGSVAVAIISGSIAATFTPPANQSVSGTVGANQSGGWTVSIVTATAASSLGKAQGNAAGITDVGVANLMVQTSTLAAITQNDNAYIVQRGDKWGNTWVSMGTKIDPVNDAILVYQGSVFNVNVAGSITGTYAEDAAHTTADKGIFMLGVRNDTMASVASADLDYTFRAVDSQGRTIIKPFIPNDGTLIEYVGSIVSGSVQLIQASAVGKRNYVTDIELSNTGAATTLLTLQGGDTSIIGQYIVPTGSGNNPSAFNLPLRSTRSQDLAFKVSPSSSVVYVNIRGYQAE